MDYEKMNATELGIVAARPGEHQAPAIAEMKRRDLEVRRSYWKGRYVDASTITILGISELSEAVTFGRITAEQREAEMERRRQYIAKLKTSSWRQRITPGGNHGR
jgi:DNA-binding helix-hairpin-helix protein with protein kinase domain